MRESDTLQYISRERSGKLVDTACVVDTVPRRAQGRAEHILLQAHPAAQGSIVEVNPSTLQPRKPRFERRFDPEARVQSRLQSPEWQKRGIDDHVAVV